MGNIQSMKKISFQDMNYCINNNYIIITVINDTNCLIKGTISIHEEEDVINNMYSSNNLIDPIIIYGRNSCDEKIINKYKQLTQLGFKNIYVYPGGLFEWLMLQDIYTNKNFKTTNNELNLLKYKPDNILIKN
tara:strand:- start:55 stop:453 length:399 start_codon:yes stop_codon:yes gene_type:complete